MFEGSFIYVQKHLSKKELELQLKQPNSQVKQQLMEQNRNTIVVKNYSSLDNDLVMEKLRNIGTVLTHSVKQPKHKDGSLIYVTMKTQQEVQDAIQ
eukprot:NODE_502_length_1669_cov_87.779630_g416_i0.p2 GENE.NODE_502_length_1669_cov_87.779630_g416_i0~~NODE_502_length_1669_cov_87.779630_g416_i0.p2  ORF type:complete len:96 (+),score=51.58 NODE_502_length_1669_cov_87.779630_g416_i0:842-1129(+)